MACRTGASRSPRSRAGPPVDNAIARGREHRHRAHRRHDAVARAVAARLQPGRPGGRQSGHPQGPRTRHRPSRIGGGLCELLRPAQHRCEQPSLRRGTTWRGGGVVLRSQVQPGCCGPVVPSLGYVPDAAGDLRDVRVQRPADPDPHRPERRRRRRLTRAPTPSRVGSVRASSWSSTTCRWTSFSPGSARGAYQAGACPVLDARLPELERHHVHRTGAAGLATDAGTEPRYAQCGLCGYGRYDQADRRRARGTGASGSGACRRRLGTEPGAGSGRRRDPGHHRPRRSPRSGASSRKPCRISTRRFKLRLLSKLDDLLSHDLPTLPLFQQPVSLVQQADIVNVSESPSWAGPLWDAEDWAIQLPPSAG